MKVTVIGAGNSGIAMSAHLAYEGNEVILWNRTKETIAKLMETRTIYCEGVIEGHVQIEKATDDISEALEDTEVVLVTTPASSHKSIAELIAKHIKKSTVIVLNPGRTFGALEFKNVYDQYNNENKQIIAETQTIIHTCRKTCEDSVNIISMKEGVLIASLDDEPNEKIIDYLPECIQKYFTSAESMIQTSIGNVGMVLHCTPLMLNCGWTESKEYGYKYYYDGITPTVARYIEKLDMERVAVAEALGYKVETTEEWLKSTYHIEGDSLYECIRNNPAYKKIDAPQSLQHRYIFEDVPCGLVPLEAIGLRLGLDMSHTTLSIDLASRLMEVDFRKNGRNLENLHIPSNRENLKTNVERRLHDEV